MRPVLPTLRSVRHALGVKGACLLLLVGALGLAPSGAHAAITCSTNSSGLPLANYNPLNELSTSAVTQLTLNCSGQADGTGTTVIATISMTAGNSNNEVDRTMTFGSNALHYNVYRDPSWSQILGDGTQGTYTFSACLTGSCNNPSSTFQASLYGAIPPGQDVAAGPYSDNLMIQIAY